MSKKKVPANLWFYDCDMGQGSVRAGNYETAYKRAVLDAGRLAQVRNVHQPTQEEVDFRLAMGGSLD